MTATTPLKAIKKKCLDCMGWQPQEVRSCPFDDCSLYPFRFGKNPFTKKREYTDAQRAKMRETLDKARLQKT